MLYLDGAWADILGWGFVLGGLVASAAAISLIDWRRRRHRAEAAAMPARLETGREWELVMHRATKELARGPRVEALQADATVSIEAAEYAYTRMLEDYVRHCAPRSAPPTAAMKPASPKPELPEPAPEQQAPAEERAPLAA